MNLNRKTAVVAGAGGFIGSHLVRRLKEEGYWVRGVDLKYPEFSETAADDFIIGDLRDPAVWSAVLDRPFDETYQLAADMGGAGYVFTGDNDANIMHNSALINLNLLTLAQERKVGRIFYSSSACIYPKHNQENTDNPHTAEHTAYPAYPDSEYGWEKLFSERMYLSFNRNYGLDVRIARFHNIFGPDGAWRLGREKAPAAICRKIAEVKHGDEIEIWGDGEQTRSFLYIDECLDGIGKLMKHASFSGPVNIGSEEMVSINKLTDMAAEIAGKKIRKKHVEGPLGVRGRNSHNDLLKHHLNWTPSKPLRHGLDITYKWVENQVKKAREEEGENYKS
ncbi:NAD-dependent epimerase/dehydratase family protein [Patescibacteria group bacterium]|nr:NAD-dependent epimerase/dehydratase family protein [Patescibacteria group bacterium]